VVAEHEVAAGAVEGRAPVTTQRVGVKRFIAQLFTAIQLSPNAGIQRDMAARARRNGTTAFATASESRGAAWNRVLAATSAPAAAARSQESGAKRMTAGFQNTCAV
jgi:hypothetical protein